MIIRVLSLNTSKEKGTIKTPVQSVNLTDRGVEGDAHGGKWHRQVSLLGLESFKNFEAKAGRMPAFGEFAENITSDGPSLYKFHPFDRLVGRDVELEVTQIGKKCHGPGCAIFQEVGECVMPREGIFCRVIRGGVLQVGDELEYQPRTLRIGVITLSDRAFDGEYADLSGPAIGNFWGTYFSQKGQKTDVDYRLIPDDAGKLEALLDELTGKVDFLFTTGGTGIGPRDFTPEVVGRRLEKPLPGIMEAIRLKYGTEKPNALLTRAVSGVIKNTLVYTLPGSVRAVNEYCTEIAKTMEHAMMMIYGIDNH